jgi:hypothetical protein
METQGTDSRLAAFVRQFGRELIKPVRLLVWALFIAAVIVGVTLLWELEKGVIAGLVVFGFFLVFTAITAHAHGEREFFRAYAKKRGMAYAEGDVALPFTTDLFDKGRKRWSEQTVVGRLPDGRDAVLGLFVYEVLRYRDPQKGTETTTEHRHTIVGTHVPELRGEIENLVVQPRTGFRFFDSAEDALKRGRHRVEVESDLLDRRYEIFVGDPDEAVVAREIFSPAFVDWLAHQPHNIGFQFERGELVVAVKGHHKSAEPLDALWQRAGEITKRLAEEGREKRPGADVRPESLKGIASGQAKGERLGKRRAAVIVAMMLVAGAGLWAYLDYEAENKSPEELAAEDREADEALEFYEENKCEINPHLFECQQKEK